MSDEKDRAIGFLMINNLLLMVAMATKPACKCPAAGATTAARTLTAIPAAAVVKGATGLTLTKIGAAGIATFGPVGWPLIGVGVMGYAAYKLFTWGDDPSSPSPES